MGLHYTEYDLRIAAYAWIVDEHDNVLLTWWNGEGRFDPAWTLPGGGIDFDEAIRDGLVREVYEETGHDIEVGELVTDHFFTRRREGHKPFRAQRFVYLARVTGGELGTVEVGGSTDFARWMPLREIAGQPARTEILDVALAAHRTAVSA